MDKLDRGFDKIIDVLGTDHHGYVARLKSAIKSVGYDDEKLVAAIWKGTAAMQANDGKELNENVFWKVFEELIPGSTKLIKDECNDSLFVDIAFADIKRIDIGIFNCPKGFCHKKISPF